MSRPETATRLPRTGAADASRETLRARYARVRSASEALCETLETEDYVVQSMPDVSPTRWHLAHTSWFFETFLLERRLEGYRPLDPAYNFLFNSYYNQVGEQFSRPRRGLLTRPTVRQVFEYRAHVDRSMLELIDGASEAALDEIGRLVELGLQHEQQHQELIVTDIKHVLAANPLHPVFRQALTAPEVVPGRSRWVPHEGGLCWIGHEGDTFAFDNETPRHRVFLERFELASRLVTCGEYLEFMRDGGYGGAELWLSDGWDVVAANRWKSPLYWIEREGEWFEFTLGGLREVRPAEPVCHVSYFEADAFARWADARLPLEAEWEVVAADVPVEGNFVEDGFFHPIALASDDKKGAPRQMFGDVWEWTASAYQPYPGFRAPEGALGEYNAKFMSGKFVLRGGSCATPADHARATYRNFFPPESRWQFTGIRLAR